ncbi:MAG: AAA family ATPase [Chitinivibrionales bacterium]|nr:AAA family ATPase [Chitinivibrionales bacterium]MBD3358774.1 AAA family ATPase [Chitinivibrionales bacterium]
MLNNSDFMKSGISGLDQILRGGLPRNRMYAIYGYSGSGKTTLAIQFLMEGARCGERCLYIGTSETETEIHDLARSHGWSLAGVDVRHRSMSFDQELEPGPSQTMLHPAEIELPRTMESLVNDIKELNPLRVVIDSLSEIRLLAREKAWYQRQLMTIKRFLAGRECTVLLTDMVDEPNSVLKTIVHGIIELRRTESTYGPDRRQLRIEKLRAHDYISGYHDYKIETGGLRVFPRLAAAEYRQSYEAETASSGIPELDRLLGGGLDCGSSTLLVGAAGTGKSSVATQFTVAAAQRGEKALVYCFDERLPSFIKRANGLGMDIDRYLRNKRIVVRTIDPAELTAGEFSHKVAESVVADEVRIVVIDSLNGYAYALPDERFLSVHLHELSSFLGERGIVTLMTLARQYGQYGGIGGSTFEISYVADVVMDFRFFERGGEIRKAVSVYKRRSGSHEYIIRELSMDSGGLHVGPALRSFADVTASVMRYTGENFTES